MGRHSGWGARPASNQGAASQASERAPCAPDGAGVYCNTECLIRWLARWQTQGRCTGLQAELVVVMLPPLLKEGPPRPRRRRTAAPEALPSTWATRCLPPAAEPAGGSFVMSAASRSTSLRICCSAGQAGRGRAGHPWRLVRRRQARYGRAGKGAAHTQPRSHISSQMHGPHPRLQFQGTRNLSHRAGRGTSQPGSLTEPNHPSSSSAWPGAAACSSAAAGRRARGPTGVCGQQGD